VEDHRDDIAAAAARRGSEETGVSERLTIEQYRVVIREDDQAMDDAMEAQNLAESARKRAAAAATQSEQGRREMMERLRHLEALVCGGPRSATPWPTRHQRRRLGISDYAPAESAGHQSRGSLQERRA